MPRFGFLWGLVEGLYSQDIESKTIVNQGIRRSAINAVFLGTIFVLIFGLIVGLFNLLPNTLLFKPPDDRLIYAIKSGLAYGLFWGCTVSIVRGGGACIQHFSLRLILYCNGISPWNYKRFLDYATELIFLQKVGGGYIFVHRMLMEHFAQMELEQKQR